MRGHTGSWGWLLALLVACTAPRKEEPCDWGALGIPEPGATESEEEPEGTDGVPAYTEAARVLVARGEDETALRVIEAGLELDPADVGLLSLRSEVLSRSGYRRAAERDLLRALDRDPGNVELWQRLGVVRLELDLPASASQALRRCEALAPAGTDPARTGLLLAEATRRCGQTAKAWPLYVEALADPLAADVEALVDGAGLYLDEQVQSRHPEDRGQAYAWINLALVREPESPRAHFVRAALLEDEGKPENAVASLQRVLELDPAYPRAAGRLALLLAEGGDGLAAAALAGVALEQDVDPELRRRLLEIVAAAPSVAAAL